LAAAVGLRQRSSLGVRNASVVLRLVAFVHVGVVVGCGPGTPVLSCGRCDRVDRLCGVAGDTSTGLSVFWWRGWPCHSCGLQGRGFLVGSISLGCC
jgi:hypothetical protein